MYYNVVQHHTIINSTKQWLTLTSDQTWNSQYPPHNRGRFKNTYELVGLGARKFSLIDKLHIFQSMCKIFCMEFQREPLKFHKKISYTYMEKDDFYSVLKIQAHSDLRARKRFGNAPRAPFQSPIRLWYILSWDLLKSQSHKIGGLNHCITLKFDGHLGS